MRPSVFCAFCLVFPLLPLIANAQLWECDGKWTNKSCEGAVGTRLKEVQVSEEEREAIKGQARRDLLATEVSNRIFEFERAKWISVSEKDWLTRYCRQPQIPIADCESEINEILASFEDLKAYKRYTKKKRKEIKKSLKLLDKLDAKERRHQAKLARKRAQMESQRKKREAEKAKKRAAKKTVKKEKQKEQKKKGKKDKNRKERGKKVTAS